MYCKCFGLDPNDIKKIIKFMEEKNCMHKGFLCSMILGGHPFQIKIIRNFKFYFIALLH